MLVVKLFYNRRGNWYLQRIIIVFLPKALSQILVFIQQTLHFLLQGINVNILLLKLHFHVCYCVFEGFEYSLKKVFNCRKTLSVENLLTRDSSLLSEWTGGSFRQKKSWISLVLIKSGCRKMAFTKVCSPFILSSRKIGSKLFFNL